MSTFYSCENCGRELELPGDAVGQTLACPYCDAEFGFDDRIVEAVPETESNEDELNTVRIKLLAADRRATLRLRSYYIVAAVGCAVGTGELIEFAVRRLRAGASAGSTTGYLLFAAVFLIGVGWFLARAVQTGRKL